jgi:hypothetical protein
MVNVIGISGKTAAGKDALCRPLVEHNPHFKRIALADMLKQDIYVLMNPSLDWAGMELEEMVAWVNERKGTLRGLLQTYGVACRELKGLDYWVNRLESYARRSRIENIVVPDVRFPNEVEGLRRIAEETDGYSLMVRLNVGPEEQARRYERSYGTLPTPEVLSHSSETSLDGYGDWDLMLNTDDLRQEQVLGLTVHFLQRFSALNMLEPPLFNGARVYAKDGVGEVRYYAAA